jgi:hypothetical protein
VTTAEDKPFITFNPDAGIGAIVGLFLFGVFGLVCALRPDLVMNWSSAFLTRFGPPAPQLQEHHRVKRSTVRARIFGVIFALLSFYFFFGLIGARS